MSAPAPRGRYGARRPTRQQRLKRLALLGAAVGTTAEEAASLAQQVAGRAARTDEELVSAFAVLAAGRPDAQGRLLAVLVDLDGRPLEDAAALLGVPVLDARAGLDLARTGGRPLPAPCRGWGLASGRSGLTAGELQAGVDHLGLCARCRDRRAAMETARRQLATRATGAAGLLGAAQLAAAGGAAVTTVGGVVAGKAVIGAVAGLGAAVLATGAAVAAVPPSSFSPVPRPAVSPAVSPVVAPTSGARPSPVPVAPRPTTTTGPCALPCVTPSAVAPLPLPTTLPGLDELDDLTGELPGDLTSDVPALPLPLPTLLPSPLLPLPLPTGLPVLPSDLPLLP